MKTNTYRIEDRHVRCDARRHHKHHLNQFGHNVGILDALHRANAGQQPRDCRVINVLNKRLRLVSTKRTELYTHHFATETIITKITYWMTNSRKSAMSSTYHSGSAEKADVGFSSCGETVCMKGPLAGLPSIWYRINSHTVL